MKTSFIVSIVCVAIASFGIWWHYNCQKAIPEEILNRSDLSSTSVSYSWTGGFSLIKSDTHAHFSGDGDASLQVGDDKLINIRISKDRYKQILTSMADNKFSQLKVKRAWGIYVCDMGKYEIILRDGDKETIVYADEKHCIDRPDSLAHILDTIYSFENEFGQRLSAGPVATTCIEDHREKNVLIVSIISAALLCGILSFVYWIKKKKTIKASQTLAR
jgi:hypothetical protein